MGTLDGISKDSLGHGVCKDPRSPAVTSSRDSVRRFSGLIALLRSVFLILNRKSVLSLSSGATLPPRGAGRESSTLF